MCAVSALWVCACVSRPVHHPAGSDMGASRAPKCVSQHEDLSARSLILRHPGCFLSFATFWTTQKDPKDSLTYKLL
jgi:hypothetical protein